MYPWIGFVSACWAKAGVRAVKASPATTGMACFMSAILLLPWSRSNALATPVHVPAHGSRPTCVREGGIVGGLSLPRTAPLLLAALATACGRPEPLTFVGRKACEGCHRAESAGWQGSHHDRAMAEASEGSVLGDFSGSTYDHFGVTSTFSKKDGRFFVRTDGPDGVLHDFEIAYTFGVDPLQQYLIRFPGGRIQALNVCWDTRPKA